MTFGKDNNFDNLSHFIQSFCKAWKQNKFQIQFILPLLKSLTSQQVVISEFWTLFLYVDFQHFILIEKCVALN